MSVSFSDPAVAPGTTPGAVWAHTRVGQDTTSGSTTSRIVAGGRSDSIFHALDPLPAAYVQGTDPTYVTLLFLSYIGFNSRIEFRLQDVSTGQGSGSPGPQLTDAAESGLGLFIRTSSGIEQAWLISDLISQTGDTEEPYSWTGLFGASGFDQDLIDALNAGDAFALLVDTDDANVDWPNLQFEVAASDLISLRPAPIDGGGEVLGVLSLTGTIALAPDPIDGGGEVSGTLSLTGSVALTPTAIDGGGEVLGVLSLASAAVTIALVPAPIDGGGEVLGVLSLASAAVTIALVPAPIDGGGEVLGVLSLTGTIALAPDPIDGGGEVLGSLGLSSPRIQSAVGEWEIEIGGRMMGPAWAQKDTVRVELRFNQRAQASFDMSIPLNELPPLTEWPRRKPVPRSRVDIWWVDVFGNRSHRFAGVLYGSPVTMNTGGQWFDYSITAPSLAARLDEVYIEGYERTIDGETVAETIVRIFNKYGGPTGITTTEVVGSDVVEPQVFDYITLREFLNRVEVQSGSAWKVTPSGSLQFRPRGGFPVAPFTLTTDNIETLSIDEDLQRHRTRQIVVGGTLPSGQKRDSFMGTGTKREYQLERRLDRIIELAVNGVSRDFGPEADGHEWIVDMERSTVTHRSSFTPLSATDEMVALYDYNGTVILAREDAVAVAAYGVVTNLHQDSSIETNEEGETALNRELSAHNSPTVIANAQTHFRDIPDVLDGELIPVNLPVMGILNERWLSNVVTDYSEGDTLMHSLELLAHDYEELGEDYWRRLQRLTDPTQAPKGLELPDGRMIDENLLLHEGLNLPSIFGGYEFSKRRDIDWARIPGSAILPLDGLRLPIKTVQVSFTAQTHNLPTGYSSAVRLYNLASLAAVADSEVVVNAIVPTPYFARGLTLAGRIANYELQCRVVPDMGGGGVGRRAGISVWGGKIDVHQ